MKKHLLILILALPFFIGQGVKAQEYIRLLEENKQWNVVDASGFGWVAATTFIYKTTLRDTLIDNKLYNIIEKYDSLSNHTSYEFVREDSTGKVFLNSNYPFANNELLLYDFSLEVGDTISLYNEIDFVVISTDSITLLNNEKRKTWKFEAANANDKCNYYPNDDDVWIEGVGSINGLLSPGCKSYTDYFQLLCFYEDGNILYKPTNEGSCFVSTVNITDKSETQINIYPNPCTDILNIQINSFYDNEARFNLFNINGQLAKSEILQNNGTGNFSINVSNLPKGVYILNIQSETRQFNKKVVIH